MNMEENFKATALNDHCVKISIDKKLNTKNLTIKLLGENRNLLISINQPENVVELCSKTDKPMFVEFIYDGTHYVKYVEGSGGEFYD